MTGIQALTEINNQQTISLWDVHATLRIKISCATYVNIKEFGKVCVIVSCVWVVCVCVCVCVCLCVCMFMCLYVFACWPVQCICNCRCDVYASVSLSKSFEKGVMFHI